MRFIALDFRIVMHYNELFLNNGEMSNNSLTKQWIIEHYRSLFEKKLSAQSLWD
jgi:hypothetical protein